jgi:SAM-dependent methyltransferase
MENQRNLWNRAYSEAPSFFGPEPSWPSSRLWKLLEDQLGLKILELGGGQGRDTLFLASRGVEVTMVACSETALAQALSNSEKSGLRDQIRLVHDDLREGMPFRDDHFDACYSHMFLCMPFSRKHLRELSSEIWRVLKPGGIHLFSVRNTHDAHYGKGRRREGQIFEIDGFPVRFFDEKMIHAFCKGFRMEEISEFQEGELPRTLYLVVARKP